jgi:DNA-binding IclR family transcriptional regulator
MKGQNKPALALIERAPLVRARPQTRRPRQVAGRTKHSASAALAGLQSTGGGVASVERALAILSVFDAGNQRLTLAELSVRTAFFKSTILRHAQSLLRHGYLQQLSDGTYQIGPKPLMLSAIYLRHLRVGDVLLPLMHELTDQTGESVTFYTRHESVCVCLHRVDSKHLVRGQVSEGDVLPLDRSSSGRILLAFAGAEGEPYERVRKDHYCAFLGEHDPETAGISAPIFGIGQVLHGSLTLAGPTSRMNEAFLNTARVPLLRIAARATGALGGDTAPIEVALASILTSKRRTARDSKVV